MATSKHVENIKFIKTIQDNKKRMLEEATIKIASGEVTFDKPHANMSKESYIKQSEKQFKSAKLKTEKTADELNLDLENQTDTLPELQIINFKNQDSSNPEGWKKTTEKGKRFTRIDKTKSHHEKSSPYHPNNKTTKAKPTIGQTILERLTYQDLAKKLKEDTGKCFIGMSKSSIISELVAKATNKAQPKAESLLTDKEVEFLQCFAVSDFCENGLNSVVWDYSVNDFLSYKGKIRSGVISSLVQKNIIIAHIKTKGDIAGTYSLTEEAKLNPEVLVIFKDKI